jgi:hypothetical protein
LQVWPSAMVQSPPQTPPTAAFATPVGTAQCRLQEMPPTNTPSVQVTWAAMGLKPSAHSRVHVSPLVMTEMSAPHTPVLAPPVTVGTVQSAEHTGAAMTPSVQVSDAEVCAAKPERHSTAQAWPLVMVVVLAPHTPVLAAFGTLVGTVQSAEHAGVDAKLPAEQATDAVTGWKLVAQATSQVPPSATVPPSETPVQTPVVAALVTAATSGAVQGCVQVMVSANAPLAQATDAELAVKPFAQVTVHAWP